MIESAAEEAGAAASVLSKVFGVAVAVVVELLTAPAFNANENIMLDKAKGLPPDAVKLKKDQGYRDKDGNTWKKDKLHKDHWDVSDRKGKKSKR